MRHHHERVDGRGYPDALAGEEIPLESRIILVADAFEAMTSDRPYRQAPGREFAVAELQRGTGSQFDADVVDALCRVLDRIPAPASRAAAELDCPRCGASRSASVSPWKGPRPASGSGTSPPTRRVVRQHGPALRPPARHAAGRACNDFLERIVHPRTAQALGRLIEHAVRDGTPYEFDLRVALPDRGERWLHARARAVRGPDGRTERITGLLSDVTERRHREEAHAFLDAASQVLAASMDPVQTLQEVAQLAVPRARGLVRGAARAGGRQLQQSPSPTSTPTRSAGRASCRTATRPTRTRRPARRP